MVKKNLLGSAGGTEGDGGGVGGGLGASDACTTAGLEDRKKR